MFKSSAEFQLQLYAVPFIKQGEIIIIKPEQKHKSITWPKWQFLLKYVAIHNQKGRCVCDKKISFTGELHHALFSRQDVVSNPHKHEIHHPYNVIVLCKDCHDTITREESALYLAEVYGKNNVKNWYKSFPMKTDKILFDYYFKET